MRSGRGRGWRWFGAWAVAAVLILLSTSFSVIGLVAIPLAILVTWLVIIRAGVWPEGLGLAFGLGLISLLLWWVNRDYQGPCYRGIVLGSGSQTSCGGFPPKPLLVAGMILLVGALLGFGLATRDSRRTPVRAAASW
jgi:hypothetical protein